MSASDTIQLTGEVVAWDKENTEEHVIAVTDREAFEDRGYTVVDLLGQVMAIRFLSWPDGTIQCQPKSTMRSRWAMAGGHTDAGFDGYFKLFVYQGGKRRTVVDGWKLFPNNEHHYAKQADKDDAFKRVAAIVAKLKGSSLEKVRGGWCLVGIS